MNRSLDSVSSLDEKIVHAYMLQVSEGSRLIVDKLTLALYS